MKLAHIVAGSAETENLCSFRLRSDAAVTLLCMIDPERNEFDMHRLDCDRMFVAVMQTGSFVAASLRLGTSAGQASKLVARLEAELGVQLLARTTRAVVPTEVGQAYYERMQTLLEEIADLDLSVSNVTQAPKGKLRMSAPVSFGTLRLTPMLNDFAALYPDIRLDVQFSDRVVNLLDEGFDLAIRLGQPGDIGLITRKLSAVQMQVVASPGYLAAKGTPQLPDDLVGHDCIIDSHAKDRSLWRFSTADGALAVEVAGRLRYSNAEACLQAAEAGLGITQVPSFVAAASLAADRVVPLLQNLQQVPDGVFAVYPSGRHLVAKLRVLVDFLADQFQGRSD